MEPRFGNWSEAWYAQTVPGFREMSSWDSRDPKQLIFVLPLDRSAGANVGLTKCKLQIRDALVYSPIDGSYACIQRTVSAPLLHSKVARSQSAWKMHLRPRIPIKDSKEPITYYLLYGSLNTPNTQRVPRVSFFCFTKIVTSYNAEQS